IRELLRTWYDCHGNTPIKAADLAESVQRIIDPQGRGRQYVAAYLRNLAGTRAGGVGLTRQDAVGAWGAATYSLRRVASETDDDVRHRDHREYRAPMPPMPDESDARQGSPGDEDDIPAETEAFI